MAGRVADVPASAHYRESTDPAVACDTCRAYSSGRCTMFEGEPAVSPSGVCDEWEKVVSDHSSRVKQLNRILKASTARAALLEPDLAAALLPILENAGDSASERFSARAGHLTASAARGLSAAGADIGSEKAMVALYPRLDEAAALAEASGEAPELLHVTLAFLGEPTADTIDAVKAAVGQVAASHAPLEGTVGGVGLFADIGSGYPAILLPDMPGLVELRQAMCAALAAADADYARNHGYTPHMTVDYKSSPVPPDHSAIGTPLHFDELALVRGNVKLLSVPLTGAAPLTAAAAGEPPGWSAPAPSEVLDVQALVRTLRTKTDPIRQALVQTVMGPAMPLTDPAKTASKLTVVEARDVRAHELRLEDQMLYWENEEAYNIGHDAVAEAGSGDAGDLWLLEDRETGTLDALANVERVGEEKMYVVHNIAAEGGKGSGTSLLRLVAQQAADAGFGVGVVATPEAEAYYSKLPYWQQGDQGDAGATFQLPAADAASFAKGAGAVASKYGNIFDVTNPLTAKVFAQTGSQIQGIAETTQADVMRIIRESYEQGLSIPDTAKAIRSGMKESSMARAVLIARTELAGAVNGGSLAATRIVEQATGDSYVKTWLTAPGAKFPRHEDYDGLDEQTVAMDEAFDVGGSPLQFPGDPDGPPEEVCNCRCTLVYVDSSGGESEGETGNE